MADSDWQITIDGDGRVACIVDQFDVSDAVTAIVVGSMPGEKTALTIYTNDPVKLTGYGIVQSVAPDNIRTSVLAFLDTLDAASLEDKALASAGGFGSPATTGQMFLAALRAEAETLP